MSTQDSRSLSDYQVEQLRKTHSYLARRQEVDPDPERGLVVQLLHDLLDGAELGDIVVSADAGPVRLLDFQDRMEETTLGTPEARALRQWTTPEQAADAVSRSSRHQAPLPKSYWQARGEFTRSLTELRQRSGLSFRALQKKTGVPRSTLADAYGRQGLVSKPLLEAVLTACGVTDRAELQNWLQRWNELAAPLERAPRLGLPPAGRG
jgi:hypothetical protein